MPVPTLPHLQFLVLDHLLGGELGGREPRERLAKDGQCKSLAVFYQLIPRVEEAGFGRV